MLRGIDISKWQGSISYPKMMSTGAPDFIMIRAGSNHSVDPLCVSNARQCEAHRIPYGLYWASYATSVVDALEEAHQLLKVAKTLKPTFPLAYDIEEFTFDGVADKSDRSNAQKFITQFCAEVEWHNYYAMFYTNLNCYKTWELENIAKRYDFWCAAWRNTKPDVDCGIWQNSNSGIIGGIKGNVDTNISYKNYPDIIARNGLNKYE